MYSYFMWWQSNNELLVAKSAILGLALIMSGCASLEYVGNGSKGFWSETPGRVSPNEAYSKAMPHLEATWTVRCEKVRDHDEWCEKHPTDHMVRRGNFYYLTRTSFPYKTHSAFLQYAVRVDASTGEVLPLDEN